jgi:hypothetical protein
MENFGHNFFSWIGGGSGLLRIVVFFGGSLLLWCILCFFNGVFKKAKTTTKSWKLGLVAVGLVFVALVVMWANANVFVKEMTKPVPVAPLLLPARGEAIVVIVDVSGVTFADLVPANQAMHIRVSKGNAKFYVDDHMLFGRHLTPKGYMTIPPQKKPWRLSIKSADVEKAKVVIELV